MDDEEIYRLRKAVHRSFGSSPHKKKYWLAFYVAISIQHIAYYHVPERERLGCFP
jgi:hypothetical protein